MYFSDVASSVGINSKSSAGGIGTWTDRASSKLALVVILQTAVVRVVDKYVLCDEGSDL